MESLQAETVDRGTCHDTRTERVFCCSECGQGITDVYLSNERDYDIINWPFYCPNCGRRVVK